MSNTENKYLVSFDADITSTVVTPNNALGVADGTFTGNTSDTWSGRWAFNWPQTAVDFVGTQTFTITARKSGATTGSPTIDSISLVYGASNTHITTLGVNTSVSSETSQTVEVITSSDPFYDTPSNWNTAGTVDGYTQLISPDGLKAVRLQNNLVLDSCAYKIASTPYDFDSVTPVLFSSVYSADNRNAFATGEASWSADSRLFVFAVRSGTLPPYEIVSLDFNTTPPTKTTVYTAPNTHLVAFPTFSPDGNTLAVFTRARESQFATGIDPKTYSVHGAVFFSRSNGTLTNLNLLLPGNGNPFGGFLAGSIGNQISWSPDGTYIAISYGSGASNADDGTYFAPRDPDGFWWRVYKWNNGSPTLLNAPNWNTERPIKRDNIAWNNFNNNYPIHYLHWDPSSKYLYIHGPFNNLYFYDYRVESTPKRITVPSFTYNTTIGGGFKLLYLRGQSRNFLLSIPDGGNSSSTVVMREVSLPGSGTLAGLSTLTTVNSVAAIPNITAVTSWGFVHAPYKHGDNTDNTLEFLALSGLQDYAVIKHTLNVGITLPTQLSDVKVEVNTTQVTDSADPIPITQATQYIASSVSGTASSPANAVGNTPTTWTADTSNTSWTHRWRLGSVPGGYAGGGTNNVTLRVRKHEGTGNPNITSVRIIEGGTTTEIRGTSFSVTSLTGVDLSIDFAGSILTAMDAVDIEIVTSAAGGGPSARAAVQLAMVTWTPVAMVPQVAGTSAVQIDSIQWNATYEGGTFPEITGAMAAQEQGYDVAFKSAVMAAVESGEDSAWLDGFLDPIYEIEVYESIESNIVVQQGDISPGIGNPKVSLQVSGLTPGTPHGWRVRQIKSGAPWTPWMEFETLVSKLEAVEQGDDTASVFGQVAISCNMAAQETTQDTASVTITVTVTAVLAAQEGLYDVLAAAGAVAVAASLQAQGQGQDIFSGTMEQTTIGVPANLRVANVIRTSARFEWDEPV